MSEDTSEERTVSLADAMNFVRKAIAENRLDDAANLLEQIIAAKPDYAEGINYLAGVRYHQRRVDEAVELTNRAAKLDPNNASIQNNLATLYLDAGDVEKAITTFREAFRLDPSQAEPLINLGRMLFLTGSIEEASVLLKKAIELNPESAQAHHRYSQLLFSLGRSKEALDHGYEALRHNPAAKKSVTLIMRATLRLEGPEAARKVLEEALKIDPDNVEAKHLLGSLSDDHMTDRAVDDYVMQTFDEFADSFDEKLEKLHYRAPDIIGDQLDKLRDGQPEGTLTMLDAGCGTGWSGERLRKHASHMTGIDLSEGMLKKADHRGLYDELQQAELVEYLQEHSKAYDAIISADTLCYFGTLRNYCEAARDALKHGGFTIFTVEKAPDGLSADFALTPAGRYNHKSFYVRSELERAGFEVLAEKEDVLREENLEDVNGLVYVARLKA